MASDGDISTLTSDGSFNTSSDFYADTSFVEDKHSLAWNSANDPADTEMASRVERHDADFDRLKRGRPRADQISSLIVEGTHKESGIRCKICRRIFPREKSLQAHMRTHTGKNLNPCYF